MSTYRPGAIVWRETMTTDLDRTTAFYRELFDWKTKDVDMGPMGIYRLFHLDEKNVAGSMQIGPDMKGMPSSWVQYISVEDVDAAAARVTANGGAVLFGPNDIPNVGRFVMITDPQGAAVALYKDKQGDMPPVSPPLAHTFCWESLNTTDKSAAAAFYAAVCGYKLGDFHGNTTFEIDEVNGGVADLGQTPPGVPPHWLSHVLVRDLEESRDRAQSLGAELMMGEITIPHTGKMSVIQDPVGAHLSLFQAFPRE